MVPPIAEEILPAAPVIPAPPGEFDFAGAWGSGGEGAGVVPVLKALLAKLEASPATAGAPPVATPSVPVRAGLHKEALYCGLSPLGSHLDEDTKEKIWGNKYVDIWSLISVDQHTVDRERRAYSERTVDRKPKVARTMNNWLQAFSVLGCVMGQRHPERCPELFTYFDSVYSAFKSHGGTAWWKYDEDFRRRLSLQPEIGWGVKATDVWLRLMMSQKQLPFQPPAAASGSSTSGAVAVRRPGACWLYNEGHCRFFGLCKYKHECSACGGPHPAARCSRPSGSTIKPAGRPDGKDSGERAKDASMVKHISG